MDLNSVRNTLSSFNCCSAAPPSAPELRIVHSRLDNQESDSDVEPQSSSSSNRRPSWTGIGCQQFQQFGLHLLPTARPTSEMVASGKHARICVCGQRFVGKSAILMQVAHNSYSLDQEYIPTLDDTITLRVDTERGTKETFVCYDTAGLDSNTPELNKQYYTFSDAYMLVYAVDKYESFNRVDRIKKEIDRLPREKDKKEIPIVVLANKCDLPEKHIVESSFAQDWAQREKVRLFEVSVTDRKSLVEPFLYLASRLFPVQKETKFTLRKGKEKPGAAIVMDL